MTFHRSVVGIGLKGAIGSTSGLPANARSGGRSSSRERSARADAARSAGTATDAARAVVGLGAEIAARRARGVVHMRSGDRSQALRAAADRRAAR